MEIEIKHTDTKGRGVFTKEPILLGEEHISECIPVQSTDLTTYSSLKLYTFNTEFGLLFAVDWTSLINDSKTPNLKFCLNNRHQLVFKAVRNIEPGEELTINYGYDVFEYAASLGIDVENWNKITMKE